ncbi:MAG: glycosyltransferase family 4 protein [Microcystaceae cyanobacterium]
MNKPLKILLVTHYFPNHRGGVEIVAGKLADILTENYPIHITWLSSNCDQPPDNTSSLTCSAMPSLNITEKSIGLPYPLWSLPSYFTLWQQVKKADIIHLHDYLYLSNLLTFIFATLQRKPWIITQHIGFIPYKNPLFRWLLSFLNHTIGKFILRQSHQTLFISEVVQNYFTNNNRFRQPSLMIPNGVDIQLFTPANPLEREQIRQQFNLNNQKPIFLFVGRFVEKKGLLYLHELAKQFPQIQWVFAGWGTLNPQNWNLPHVCVLEGLSGKTLVPIYQMADLLILPSQGEGFPLVVQEAMACGTPALVNTETAKAYHAVQDIILTANLGNANDLQQWRDKIAEILAESSILSQLRTPVAKFAQEHWSWQKTAQRYWTLFERI